MTIACVIPARFQSSRFPGKLLAKAGGKTVLQQTFESASRCKELNALYVATDDERIAEHVRSLNGEVIWTSPSCRNGTERIIEACRSHKALQAADYVVNLQGDHPCTAPETISAVAKALKEDPSAVMSTAVTKLLSSSDYLSPHIVKAVFDKEYRALYFSRSPIPYNFPEEPLTAYGHIGIYCFRGPFLLESASFGESLLSKLEDLEQLKILERGYRIKIALVEEEILGVDTPHDLVKLEQKLCLQNTFS